MTRHQRARQYIALIATCILCPALIGHDNNIATPYGIQQITSVTSGQLKPTHIDTGNVIQSTIHHTVAAGAAHILRLAGQYAGHMLKTAHTYFKHRPILSRAWHHFYDGFTHAIVPQENAYREIQPKDSIEEIIQNLNNTQKIALIEALKSNMQRQAEKKS